MFLVVTVFHVASLIRFLIAFTGTRPVIIPTTCFVTSFDSRRFLRCWMNPFTPSGWLRTSFCPSTDSTPFFNYADLRICAWHIFFRCAWKFVCLVRSFCMSGGGHTQMWPFCTQGSLPLYCPLPIFQISPTSWLKDTVRPPVKLSLPWRTSGTLQPDTI